MDDPGGATALDLYHVLGMHITLVTGLDTVVLDSGRDTGQRGHAAWDHSPFSLPSRCLALFPQT